LDHSVNKFVFLNNWLPPSASWLNLLTYGAVAGARGAAPDCAGSTEERNQWMREIGL
jgi:hypothetical protein